MKFPLKPLILLAVVPILALCAEPAITPDAQAALDRISADSLKAHVSFLASDRLQGRDTPSEGLDLAADYIAAQFRRAGLEPVGDDGYFETATYSNITPNYEGFEMTLEAGGKTTKVPKDQVYYLAPAPSNIAAAPLLKLTLRELEKWTPEQVSGKVIVLQLDLMDTSGDSRALRDNLERLKPALTITLAPRIVVTMGMLPQLREASQPAPPQVAYVIDPELTKAIKALPSGETGATITFHSAGATFQPVKLRNVAGLLRGSDPKLKDTYILVTAHYDHVGVKGTSGDRIYNGANDDASGTASVIELASALAAMRVKPRRSVLFMTYFGEEKGMFGSKYYSRHPLEPIDRTVANINLEQLGRTDDREPQVARASMTGFDYTDLGPVFQKAGEEVGITLVNDPKKSDFYYALSDNQSLADVGVPAHTVLVAYYFSDYHKPGDEWPKLDYPNMQKVDRMIALGLLMIADNPEPPKWNEANPKAARYIKGRRNGKQDVIIHQ